MGDDIATIRASIGHEGDGVIRLGIIGTGFEVVDGHYVYIFQILHPWGSTWRLKKRYNDLLDLHKELSLDSWPNPLPVFPPKHTINDRLWTPERDVAARRIAEFQRYLQSLASRREFAQSPLVLRVLGETEPQAPVSVQVRKWEPEQSGNTIAHLDVQLVESCYAGPVEAIEVLVRVSKHPGLAPEAQSLEADGKIFVSIYRQPVCITGLPNGYEIEFEVRTRNSVGSSLPATIHCAVPGEVRPVKHSSPPSLQLSEGCRVMAVWAGDGEWYDAIVRHMHGDGMVTVDWLRPKPLSSETMHCVCEAGGDDTSHRRVSVKQIRGKQDLGDPMVTETVAVKESGVASTRLSQGLSKGEGLFGDGDDEEPLVPSRARRNPKKEAADLFSQGDSDLFPEPEGESNSKTTSQRSSKKNDSGDLFSENDSDPFADAPRASKASSHRTSSRKDDPVDLFLENDTDPFAETDDVSRASKASSQRSSSKKADSVDLFSEGSDPFAEESDPDASRKAGQRTSSKLSNLFEEEDALEDMPFPKQQSRHSAKVATRPQFLGPSDEQSLDTVVVSRKPVNLITDDESAVFSEEPTESGSLGDQNMFEDEAFKSEDQVVNDESPNVNTESSPDVFGQNVSENEFSTSGAQVLIDDLPKVDTLPSSDAADDPEEEDPLKAPSGSMVEARGVESSETSEFAAVSSTFAKDVEEEPITPAEPHQAGQLLAEGVHEIETEDLQAEETAEFAAVSSALEDESLDEVPSKDVEPHPSSELLVHEDENVEVVEDSKPEDTSESAGVLPTRESKLVDEMPLARENARDFELEDDVTHMPSSRESDLPNAEQTSSTAEEVKPLPTDEDEAKSLPSGDTEFAPTLASEDK